MSKQQIQKAQEKLEKALIALKVALDAEKQDNRLNIDATIQRFEFTIELFWKFLQRILNAKGVEVRFPKDVLKEAYAGKLIDDEQTWLAMLHDKNVTSHTYDELQADIIYNHIKQYYPLLQNSFNALIKQL
ncbi:MAG TPA: HI0074 family nucleotidyltransferase substrate-binding subunit [Candidatus Babeliales bacterium]|jgi:nucleotidyltransferase substrate binding protein (TIGR01987 family)|nr:HI0074 family nucleotidyltransferase substrate-binding subunit [Candidatus Babeliales bacterium]